MKNYSITVLFSILIAMLGNETLAQNDQSFLNPPKIVLNPSSVENYNSANRKFTGISSMAVTPGGRMWVVWYAGKTPGEDLNNYVVVSTSEDNGKTWEEILVIDPDGTGPVRAFDPEVWLAPNGQLWVFWAQHVHPVRSTSSGVWAITTSTPEMKNPEWSKPRRLVNGVMMCKPIVLSSGEWALPVSYWHVWEESAKMVISTDQGVSWQVRGAVTVPRDIRNHDEHMIVERKDSSLWMLIRTKNGIGESISKDRGYTWSPIIPSRIQHTASRFFIYRLKSGNLLLVKHGPIDMRTGRSHLMAFLSIDDGHSWSNGLLIDERPGVSYPDGQQTNDGNIYITYDYSRTKEKDILITSFTENDINNNTDNTILEVFNRRIVVNQEFENK